MSVLRSPGSKSMITEILEFLSVLLSSAAHVRLLRAVLFHLAANVENIFLVCMRTVRLRNGACRPHIKDVIVFISFLHAITLALEATSTAGMPATIPIIRKNCSCDATHWACTRARCSVPIISTENGRSTLSLSLSHADTAYDKILAAHGHLASVLFLPASFTMRSAIIFCCVHFVVVFVGQPVCAPGI